MVATTTNPTARKRVVKEAAPKKAATVRVKAEPQPDAVPETLEVTLPVLKPGQKHPLAHLIPDEWFYDEYTGRKIGGVDDLVILDEAYEMNHNVILEGPTGSAKTSLIYAWAASRGVPVVNIPCNGAAEPRMFAGGWVPTPSGGAIFVPGDLYLAVGYGGMGYFDEINMMPGKIGAYTHGLFDKRRIMTIPDAKGSEWPTSLVASGEFFGTGSQNPGYHDTFDLNEAFKNRFAIKLPWGYDENVEMQMINSINLITAMGELRKRVEDGTLRTPVPTNLMLEFEQFAERKRLGFGFAVENLIAAFHEDERSVVREALKAWIPHIRTDLQTAGVIK
jgi:hypothetical protein